MRAVASVLLLLLASLSAAPAASAQSACAPTDVEYWYDAGGEERSSASEIPPGARAWAQANAPVACDGQILTLVVCDSATGAHVERHSNQLYQPRPGTDFVYWEATFDAPAKDGRIELWFGQEGSGVLLDAAGEGACATDAPCPEDLEANANGDGSITLRWSAVDDALGYEVHRTSSDGHVLWAVEETTFTDRGTVVGQTYTYEVRAVTAGGTSTDCPSVEVTAVPFFAAPILGAVALAGGVGAYVAMRRRS